MKQCNRCLKFKDIIEFFTCGKYKDTVYHRGECKECSSILQKNPKYKKSQSDYRKTEEYKTKRKEYRTLEHVKEAEKQYEEKRSDIRRKQSWERKKFRYYNDPKYRLMFLSRKRTREMLKVKGWNKNNKFKNYIGCDIEFLKSYIEAKFTEGMSWEVFFQGKIHIDHIIPLSSANTEEELYKLCHYTNLQPLWALDNLSKSDKITK